MNITVKTILEVTGGSLLAGDENLRVTDICIDSRKIKEGDLFVPIVGEKTDAHIYIPQTMQVGAATLTRQDISEFEPGRAYIRVSETEQALKAIGRYVRSLYPNKIIGVTGSVGKTTTREMITAALSGNCRVYHTEGNLNSQIGVPITLSRMNDQPSDLAVLEMGISEEGHMDSLTDMVKPDIAVVTMIGVAHIEFMKTQENIRREKLKIAARMGENGVLFLNGDDPLLADMRGKNQVKTFYYGTADWCDYRAENIRLEQGMNVYEYVHGATRQTVRLSALGRHNVLNSLVGLAINDYLGLNLARAAEGFAEFTGLRQKVITASKGYTVIDDTYNASPDSMKASIGVLCDLNSAGRKIAVLGDMFELGENSSQYHQEVGRYLAQREIDELVTVGELSLDIAKGAKADEKLLIHSFPDTQSAAAYLKQILKSQDVVLLKASNGMKLGRIAESIC